MKSTLAFVFTRKRVARYLPFLVVTLIAVFCVEGILGLKAGLGGDATQNFLSSYNLYSNSEYGRHLGSAGFRREPFPNWILAFFMHIFVRPPRGLSEDQILSLPEVLDKSVQINIFWAISLFVSLWILSRLLFKNSLVADLVAINSIVISQAVFVKQEMSNLNTELPASVLICLLSIALISSLRTKLWWWVVISGLFYGLLVLTKASGAYVAFLTMPFAAICIAISPEMGFKQNFKHALKYFLCIAIGFLVVVTPWITRNYFEFGQPSIAMGGGRVLWIRSEYNKINREQYIGSFYAFSPKGLQMHFWEPLLGYSKNQLDCGGSLQLFSRNLPCDNQLREQGRYDEVVSLYDRGKKALPQKYKERAIEKGIDYNNDDLGKQVFIENIKANPRSHLALTLPLAWRGIWSFVVFDMFGLFVNFVFMVNLILMPLVSLILRNKTLFLLSLLPASYYWFYALFSQFWTRFSEPFIPISSILFLYLIANVVVPYFQKRRFNT